MPILDLLLASCAAFIPLFAAVMVKYGEEGGGTIEQGHGMLVAVSLIAGVILMAVKHFGAALGLFQALKESHFSQHPLPKSN